MNLDSNPADAAPFAARNVQPELMDQPGLDPLAHRRALAGLARINRFSFSERILWPEIAALVRQFPERPLSILDIATGGGDLPIALCRRAKRAGIKLNMAACDISETALSHARLQAQRAGTPVRFFQFDPLSAPLRDSYDIVVTSLFLHHLADSAAVILLSRMAAAARRMVIVNDLERGRAGWMLAWAGTRLLSRSSIVHVDGPRSVAAAFTVSEVCRMAGQAGLGNPRITRHWPFRYRLVWRRP